MLMRILLFLSFLFAWVRAETPSSVIVGQEAGRTQNLGCIESRNNFWDTYQVDGKRLNYKDFVSLYKNTGDAGLAGRYEASVWLRYVVPYVVMFGSVGLGIANHWRTAYILPGLGLGIVTGFVGKAMFVNSINQYNSWVGKKSNQTGLKGCPGRRYGLAISFDM
jgi:hypothetical protein